MDGQLTMFGEASGRVESSPGLEAWVKDNRSGAASAWIKAMRMGKIGHALYWLTVLSRGKLSPWYLARRLFISAAEDSVDYRVFELAFNTFKQSTSPTLEDLAKGTVAVCKGLHFYDNEYGKSKMRNWMHAEKEWKRDGKPTTTLEKGYARMGDALLKIRGDEGHVESYLALLSIWEDTDFSHEAYLQFCAMEAHFLADKGEDPRLEKLALMVEATMKELVRYKDWNWDDVLRWACCGGVTEGTWTVSDDGVREALQAVEKIVDQDAKDWDLEIPSWALDGMHASKGAKFKDPRFAGTKKGIYNVILMYKEHGRLDPRDQGEIIKVPEEGLVLGHEDLEEITA